MHQVDITYRAGTDGPPRGVLHRTMPSRWQDLTPEQAWHCMDMVIRGCRRTELVEYLIQLPAYIHQRLQPGEIYDLLRLITWMEIDTASTAPIAPYIEVEGIRLYLPSAQFASVTCLEYVLIDELYTQYIQTQPQDMDMEMRLVALTLRPAGPSHDPSSDPRVQLLSTEQTAEWMHLIRQLPESIRVYIVTLISANRAWVHEQYAHWLFTQQPILRTDGDDDTEIQADDSGLNFGWWGAYLDVAADAVFGTYDQVLHTPFHTVCMHMVRKIEAARLQKQEHDHALARSRS